MPRLERDSHGGRPAPLPVAPERQGYKVPKPWTKKAIPEGYALFASNGNEVMRFVATANTAEFPEGRTLAEASQHADRMLDIIMGDPALAA